MRFRVELLIEAASQTDAVIQIEKLSPAIEKLIAKVTVEPEQPLAPVRRAAPRPTRTRDGNLTLSGAGTASPATATAAKARARRDDA